MAKIGLCCVAPEDSTERPFTNFRRCIQHILMKIFRLIFFFMGFHKIDVIGHQASKANAPILVCAPHSTIVDAIAILISRAIPVAKKAMSEIVFLGAVGKCMQVLFVTRESKESRKGVVEQIKKIALEKPIPKETSQDSCCKGQEKLRDWPQIFIFPEGTCTNAKALIKFKTGAFQPGCSVQPVLFLREGNGLDTLTWTWNQSYGAFGCLWLTLCKLNTNIKIEFLPIYDPTKDEIGDARLYAENVRSRMASRLQIPKVERSVSEFTSATTASAWSVDNLA